MEDKKAGVMIPIPQYPLYSAAITELNAHAVRKREREEEKRRGKVKDGEYRMEKGRDRTIILCLIDKLLS